jgi:hypothetical protein
MSLDKAIQHGKEHRKGYAERGKPGRFDLSCRPHGAGHTRPCPYCERNRLLWRKRMAEVERFELQQITPP